MKRRSWSTWTSIATLAFGIAHAPVAHAQNKAAADVLFQAAREAMARNDYDEACLKFEESNRADPAVGTVLNLGNCEEQRGNLASSWERYTEAMGMMDPSDRRYAFAKSKAENLEPQVPRLVVDLAEGSPDGTEVQLNGQAYPGKIGASVRVNPGAYTLTVSAPGFEAGSYSVQLDAGETQRLTVAPGEELPKSEAPTAPPPPPLVVRIADTSSRDTLQWVTGVASLVGLAAGGTLGVLTYQSWGEFADKCDTSTSPARCNQEGKSAGDTGRIFGYTAIGAGALGLVSGGLFLYFTFSEPNETISKVGFSPIAGAPGLSVQGRF